MREVNVKITSSTRPRLTHQVRANGQHRVLASDGRWRRTHTRVSPNRNLRRPGDKIIDQRPGSFRRNMLALVRGFKIASAGWMLGVSKLAASAIKAAAEFEKMHARLAAQQRALDVEAVRQEHDA